MRFYLGRARFRLFRRGRPRLHQASLIRSQPCLPARGARQERDATRGLGRWIRRRELGLGLGALCVPTQHPFGCGGAALWNSRPFRLKARHIWNLDRVFSIAALADALSSPFPTIVNIPAAIASLPDRTPALVDLLESWANINSGSGNLAGLDRMRAALRATFAPAFPGAAVDEPACPGTARALRLIMRPSASVRILFSGHFDTVFEANDPFQRCTRPDDKTLRGPGVIDMKGGLLTILACLQAFEQTPSSSRIGWEILLTPDEETGTHGSRPLFEIAAKRNHFGLVFEPARPNGDIVKSRKGTGGYRVTCRGKAAHAAKVPNDGRNAILGLSEFLLAASRLPAEIPGVLLNVGNIRGGGPATNVVPDFAESELDVRVTTASDRAELEKRIAELAGRIDGRDGFRLELKGWFNRPPKECGPVEEKVFRDWRTAASDLGVPPFNWVHTGGASDGNFLSAFGLPNLDGVGPIGDQLHSDREFIVTPSIAPRAQVAALFLHRLAAGDVSLV